MADKQFPAETKFKAARALLEQKRAKDVPTRNQSKGDGKSKFNFHRCAARCNIEDIKSSLGERGVKSGIVLEEQIAKEMPTMNQSREDEKPKVNLSRSAAGCDAEHIASSLGGMGDKSGILYNHKNSIKDDDDDMIYSESFLYCKPHSNIGKRKALKKRKQPKGAREGGDQQDSRPLPSKLEESSNRRLPTNFSSIVTCMKEKQNSNPSEDLLKEKVDVSTTALQHHQARLRAVKFATSDKQTYVASPHVSAHKTPNVQELRVKECTKQQKATLPQIHLPTYPLTGVSEVSQLSSEAEAGSGQFIKFKPVVPQMSVSGTSFSDINVASSNFILVPKEDFLRYQAGRVLASNSHGMSAEDEIVHPNEPKDNKEDDIKLCHRCKKQAYLAERRVAAGQVFHIHCFSCFTCGKYLDVSTLQEKNSELYCKFCFIT